MVFAKIEAPVAAVAVECGFIYGSCRRGGAVGEIAYGSGRLEPLLYENCLPR